LFGYGCHHRKERRKEQRLLTIAGDWGFADAARSSGVEAVHMVGDVVGEKKS